MHVVKSFESKSKGPSGSDLSDGKGGLRREYKYCQELSGGL